METRLLIGGDLVAGEGAPLAVENPATEEIFAAVAGASTSQVGAAVAAARRAQRDWGVVLTAAERAELLHGIASGLRARTEELAVLMTAEGGKPLLENRDEVGWTASAFDFYAELARAEQGRVIPPVENTQLAMVIREPLGVVACIVPWNYPLLLLAWKLA
ncbi:MAG: aldehyde dehydrogenase family protein, partial [Solirubrobacteraceae bacterium]|nr:aldehyde dehydrogenase family protein [Solirubrobacteraceae bacterium]